VSRLWDQCKSALKERLKPADWRTCIEPLRVWLHGDALYLWVDRARDDYRSIGNPARDFGEQIRDAVCQARGRGGLTLHFLERPPNRERMVTDQRVPEHRQKRRRHEDLEEQALLQYAKEECRKLYRDSGGLLLRGTRDERIRKLHAIVIERAKVRLEKEGLPKKGAAHDAPPPDTPSEPTRR